jgi:D-3-phosphoglycerate dehydrogenase
MVRYGAFRGEFDLSGHLVLIHGIDKPGVIGKVGTTLGARGVNISHFQFARKEQGGEALLFLNTDTKIDEEAVKALEALENVESVRRVTI